jgi:2-iminobutanoate/2-iminopropanoate deaminase
VTTRSDGGPHIIETPNAPAHRGPVPQAVEVDGWIFVSALFGTRPGTGGVADDATDEADQLFVNLAAILAAADATLGDVVRVGIVMRNLQRDRPVFNTVWQTHFGDHRPARSAVEVSDFGRPGEGARFMVEVTARRRTPAG